MHLRDDLQVHAERLARRFYVALGKRDLCPRYALIRNGVEQVLDDV